MRYLTHQKKKEVLFSSTILFASLFFMTNKSLADDFDYGQSITIDESMSIIEKEDALSDFENNPDVTELIVLDESLLNNEFIEDIDNNFDDQIQSRAGVTKYRVTGVKNGNDYTGGAIATTSGGPGVNLKISQKKSISTSFSGSFGASNKILNASLGWNVTGSTSVSIEGAYKVPSKIGNKKVKTATLKAHTVYKVKNYNVEKMAWNSTKWSKAGSGNSKKAYGIAFKKSYTYK